MADASKQTIVSGKIRRKKGMKRMPKSTTGQLKVLKSAVSRIKKDMKGAVEVKSFDTTVIPTTAGWNGAFVDNINQCTAGFNSNQRVGDNINMTGFDFRYNLVQGTQACTCRVILFIDHENNLIRDNILDNRLGLALTSQAPLMMYARSSRNDFTVLYDEVHTLDNVENYQVTKRVHQTFSKIVKFGTASNNIFENGLRLLVISSISNAAGVAQPQFSYNSRVYYKDA